MEYSFVDNQPKFSLIVYDDCAIIRGKMTVEVLTLLFKFCKKEGFTHLTNTDDSVQGFKFVRKDKE